MTPQDLSACFRPAMEIFARVVEGPASKCDRRRAGLVTQLQVGKDMPKHLSGWHVLARERRWKYDAVVSSRWTKLWRARLLLVASRGSSRLLHSSAFDFPATPTSLYTTTTSLPDNRLQAELSRPGIHIVAVDSLAAHENNSSV